MSAQEIRSLVWAFVIPASEEGFVTRGEAGDSKIHCQVVMFRGTGIVEIRKYARRNETVILEDLHLISGCLLLNGILRETHSTEQLVNLKQFIMKDETSSKDKKTSIEKRTKLLPDNTSLFRNCGCSVFQVCEKMRFVVLQRS